MKKTLIRNTIISLLIIILISGIFNYIRIRNSLIDQAYVDIGESLDGYIYLLSSGDDLDIDKSTKDFGEYTNNRITVVDAVTGEVLGDSFNDITQMDNHLYREEISEAIKSGEGDSIRYSRTEKMDFIYHAKLVEFNGNSIVVRASKSLGNIKSTYNLIAGSMLIAIIISAAIAFFVSYTYNRKIIVPIENLTEFARSISKGDYGKSIYINSYDEVTMLSKALNKLSKSLKKSFNKIETKNAQLEAILHSLSQGILVCRIDGKVQYTNDTFLKIININEDIIGKNIYHNIFDDNLYEIVDELKDADENITITKSNIQFSDDTYRNYSGCYIKDSDGEKRGILLVVEDVTNIRKLERMRSVFVSNVTHELKTPITSISGYAQTLLNGAINDKENAYKFLNIIDDEAQRLNLLIDDILTLADLEKQTKPEFRSRVTLKDVAGEVIELIKQKYPNKKDVEYIIENRDNCETTMLGDSHKLKQVLINLIDNSAKHTQTGYVKVVFEKNEDRLTMSVEDTGIGIDKKHHDRIFERFYRVDKHRSRETGGTGLGLSIVKHLVILHGGEISIDSKVGVGTKISIAFPVQ